MHTNFKLLINNPILETANYILIKSEYINQCLSSYLYLPQITSRPFIFSCFALSVDGKLNYPDLKSGFAIAKYNLAATEHERYADWWILQLARSISDAVIIGSNSLNAEPNDYVAQINIPELQQLRTELNKPQNLLHIVISRNCNKIDFANELLCQENDIPLIIFAQQAPNVLPSHFIVSNIKELNLANKKQIILDNALDLNRLIQELYQKGIKTILNESPYYHHHLQQLQLLDEAWINQSGVYIGGNTSSLGQFNNSFAVNVHPHYTILTLHSLGYNFVYPRYKISY
jgi:riboflavin biosynthesis pyrimidine reductase